MNDASALIALYGIFTSANAEKLLYCQFVNLIFNNQNINIHIIYIDGSFYDCYCTYCYYQISVQN